MSAFQQKDKVPILEVQEEWREEGLLVGQMMIMAVVGMNMKEVPAFIRMEVALVITMKIRGAIMATTIIFLLNVEAFPHQGGKIILTEDPGRIHTQGGRWILVHVRHLHITYETRASILHPDRFQRAGKIR